MTTFALFSKSLFLPLCFNLCFHFSFLLLFFFYSLQSCFIFLKNQWRNWNQMDNELNYRWLTLFIAASAEALLFSVILWFVTLSLVFKKFLYFFQVIPWYWKWKQIFCLLYRSWSEKKIECNLPNNNSDLLTFYSICSNKKFVVEGYFSHQQDLPWRHWYVIFWSSSQTQKLKPFLNRLEFILILCSLLFWVFAYCTCSLCHSNNMVFKRNAPVAVAGSLLLEHLVIRMSFLKLPWFKIKDKELIRRGCSGCL